MAKHTCLVAVVFAAICKLSVQGSLLKNCEDEFKKIGCFEQRWPNYANLLLNDRSIIPWNDIESFIKHVACKCNEFAKKANKDRSDKYVGFAIHNWGECFGKTQADIDAVGLKKQSHKCTGDQSYSGCKKEHAGCVGHDFVDYIYLLSVEAEKNVDGGYSKWESWTPCKGKCGTGIRARERTCTNPLPQGKGKDCTSLGNSTEVEECQLSTPCPVDGNWGNWDDFKQCSASCGGGKQIRQRFCNNPSPGHGGLPCDGLSTESQDCNTEHCPVHGGWSGWSKYTECSKKCGGGVQKRTRGCTNPAPQYGGQDCAGDTVQSIQCNKNPCPVDGGYTRWTAYGKCNKKCGGGRQYRTRTCTNPRPAHGGKDCRRLGPATEMRACNKHACIAKEYTKHCCEGGSLSMHCLSSRRLKIHYATYGRKSRKICGHWLSWAMNTNCRAGHSTNKVRQACEGKTFCTVRANNRVFGDPCWGTKKYLQVTYSCPE